MLKRGNASFYPCCGVLMFTDPRAVGVLRKLTHLAVGKRLHRESSSPLNGTFAVKISKHRIRF